MRTEKKLAAVIVLFALVPLLIITCSLGTIMKSSMASLQQDYLQDLADVVSWHIHDFYENRENEVAIFAEMLPCKEWLQARADGDKERSKYWEKETTAFLKDISYINQSIHDVTLIDGAGLVLLSSGEGEAGKSVVRTKAYESVVGGEKIYESIVIEEEGKSRISLTVPISDDKQKLLGLLEVTFDLQGISHCIESVQGRETGHVYLFDQNALMIYCGGEREMDLAEGEFQNRTELDQLLRAVSEDTLEDPKGIVRYSENGREITGAYRQVPKLDWVTVVAMEDDELFDEVNQTIFRMFLFAALVAILFIVFGHGFLKRQLLPVTNLKNRFRRVLAGNYAVWKTPYKSDVLNELSECINDTAIRLKKHEGQMESAKTHDLLTGLYTREAFSQAVEDRRTHFLQGALIFLDLDDLQTINGQSGYAVGDSVLCEVAGLLKKLPKETVIVGRLCSDQFLIYVSNCQRESVTEIAESLGESISRIAFVNNCPVCISASMGIAYSEEDSLNMERLMNKAKVALLKSKSLGKNTYAEYAENAENGRKR